MPTTWNIDIRNVLAEKLAEKLREELRQLSHSFIPEMVPLIPGTNNPAELRHIYNAKISVYDKAGNYLYDETDIPLHEYWGASLTIPRGRNWFMIRSRQSVRYGYMVAYMKYPNWTGLGYDNGTGLWLGFELGAGERHGIASWFLVRHSNVNKLFAHIGGGGVFFNTEQTVSLPSDYTTARHGYWVKINRNQVWFGIDNRIRGFTLLANSQVNLPLASNANPYFINIVPVPVPTLQHLLIEFQVCIGGKFIGVPRDVTIGGLGFSDIRWCEGDPQPPLALPLYVANTDTLMAGQSISSGSLTSHPIPVFGYDKKTIYFMSDQAGTLEIQVFTLSGNWRTYDSVSVSANTLIRYSITDATLLVRVVFTPSTYPAKILEAMAVMH